MHERVSKTAVAIGLMAVLAGCSYYQRREAVSTEQLLAAAHFKVIPADTPERMAQLKTFPTRKLVMRSKDGKPVYTYADPDNCQCLYVGGPDEYRRYQELSLEKQEAEDRLYASEADEDAAMMDWGPWGPWGPWW